MTKITLSYKRDPGAEMTSSGVIAVERGVAGDAGHGVWFAHIPFGRMISKLCEELRRLPENDGEVFIERIDREGLLPYKLDAETVKLIRTDPVAAAEAMTYTTASPSTAVRRAQKRDVPIVPQPVLIGTDVLAQTFGDELYFRVRGNELECPGCGFWSPFAMKGMLEDPERVGHSFHTIFACQKKCKEHFQVRCWEKWGSVGALYLLEQTKLEAFYFPRPWNDGRPWIGRRELQLKFDEYQKEKES